MKPITLTETSQVSNSYQTEHGTYEVQRKPYMHMQMRRNKAMREAKHNEMRPWERQNIWLRNGTHLELYSFEHEYSLPARNKATRKTMNEK